MKYIIKELKLTLISILILVVFYGTSALLFINPWLWLVVSVVIILFLFNRIVEYVIIPSLKENSTKFNRKDTSSKRPRLWKDVNRNDKDSRTSFNHENFNKPTGKPPLKLKRSD
jgi:hypothetical protein